jgi:hypothetical protein
MSEVNIILIYECIMIPESRDFRRNGNWTFAIYLSK